MPVPNSSQQKPEDIQIIVKFIPRFNVPYIDLPEKTFNDPDFKALWKDIIDELPGFFLNRVFTRVPIARFKKLVIEAMKRNPAYVPVDFSKYFYYQAKKKDVKTILPILSNSPLFELVEVDEQTEPPTCIKTAEPEYGRQEYLHPAPRGINAAAAWVVGGGTGSGVKFCDIEQGWNFNHEDLNTTEAGTLISGRNQAYKDHGGAVLGIVISQCNRLGCIGIAPDCTAVTISEYNDIGVYLRADAISFAIDNLDAGDVLLLEMQNSDLYPIESIETCRIAIQLATGLGIVVIEPAANGNVDLDALLVGGRNIFNSTSGDFTDTQSIMVGGVNSTNLSRSDTRRSNFGGRVDCFAWFNNITTLGSPPSGYRHDFDGTSGASAIIAGAVVSLQGILKNRGRIYNSSQMRAWISNPLLGTPSNDMINDLVGVMPDLEKLIDDLDHPSVDIYVRDNIDDNGSRYAGMISASPDVITKPFAVMNPDTAFGAGSGTENTRDLGNSILAGLDNYIYVRVKNKGLTPMNNVQVQVYYSEVGTLITPDRWNLIGNTTIPVVPAGDILTVTPNPIVWPAAEIPASGHYCYVCLIGCTEDPMPDPILLSLADWDDFNNMIRDNNNITWRNFNVINLVPASYHMPLPVPFNMHGAQNKKVKFGFQLAHTFPYGTRIQLEFPADLLPEMSKTGHPIFKNEDANYITWDHGNVIVLENMELPESYKGRCRIMINFPENELELNMPHFLTITQLYKNKIAGKITWEIKPPETA